MIITLNPAGVPSLPANRGILQREWTSRPERVPENQRIDLPEIAESYRVSFSEQAKSGASLALKNNTQNTSPAELAQTGSNLAMYQRIAAL